MISAWDSCALLPLVVLADARDTQLVTADGRLGRRVQDTPWGRRVALLDA